MILAGGNYFAKEKDMSLEFLTSRSATADQVLKYTCDACQETREIGQFLDIFDPVTKVFDLVVAEKTEEEIVSRCFYFAKFNKTSNWHSVWLPYSKACKSSKFRPFIKRIREADQDMERTKCLIPQKILTVHFQQGKDWKYSLVKWKSLDYEFCTWETT